MIQLPSQVVASAAVNMQSHWQDEDQQWQAVVAKDASADGLFFFAVKTTGVYCWPSCGSRRPRRDNVAFFSERNEAEAAGFRPCKRCRPDLAPLAERLARAIAGACETITNADESVSLKTLAESAGMSPYYFQRTFKKIVGITPKQFEVAQRDQRLKENLRANAGVTDAIYASGFNASSRYYEQSKARLGMTATQLKQGGKGLAIEFTIADCWLGRVLIAATERGVCAIFFASDDGELTAALNEQFPAASITKAKRGSQLEQWVAQALELIADPATPQDLPLDVMGTAFQERVWRALRSIKPGETATYSQIAKSIGAPNAARAVATACAANVAAIAIPCHRVIRADGNLSGYRWGAQRKAEILNRERELNHREETHKAKLRKHERELTSTKE